MKRNNKKYALKEMSKVKIIDRRSEKNIKSEREFLSILRHPFIVNMNCAFQDYDNLYLVMDLLTGGDLRYHLCKIRQFSENETKFFIACLILGLEYIHNNNIIHRDIKPENLVLDEKGYLRITDFGVAKIHKEDNSSETSGTPGYMAPEVLMAQNHSFPVDFFAIGVMGYEFMIGKRPYIGKNRKEIKHLVLRKQARIDEDNIVDGWGEESVDFINRCLKRKVSRRLGYVSGIRELKEHEWFKNFDWNALLNKNIIAPFIPGKDGNYDKKYCEGVEKLSEETLERYQNYREKNNFTNLFDGYTYVNIELVQMTMSNDSNTRVNTKYSKQLFTTNSNISIKNAKNPILLKQNDVSLSPKNKTNLNNNLVIYENKDKKNKKNALNQLKAGDNLNNLALSSSAFFNLNNRNANNIKKINELINSDAKLMRNGSVGISQKFNQQHLIEENTNINNNIILSNISNNNDIVDKTFINCRNPQSNKSGGSSPNKINFLDNINNIMGSTSRLLKNNNKNSLIKNKYDRNLPHIKNNNSKNVSSFYLPQLGGKVNDMSNRELNNKNKILNKVKYKLGKNKHEMDMNSNKLLIIPGNNYHQPMLKKSESTGLFFNNGMSLNNSKPKKMLYYKNQGIKNSDRGYANLKEKKLYKNSSDIFG